MRTAHHAPAIPAARARRIAPARIGLFAVLALGGLTACASGTTRAPGAQQPSDNNRRISEEQLTALSVSSAWDAVERLRPLWLRSAGARSRSARITTEIVVITDGQYFGGVASLRSIPAEAVNEIVFMTGPEATNAWPWLANGRHVESAIVVYQGTRVR